MNTINYMQRARDLYRAQGFDKDYVWAKTDDIPFSTLDKPLKDCTVAIVTTVVIEPEIPKQMRAAASYSFEELPDRPDTDELAWDKITTNTDDRQSYFPLEVLEALAAKGEIGGLAPRFHFVPTEYSQKNTLEKDAPAIAASCLEDKVDIALLVPL